jgi:hypothetical protein
MKSSGKLLRLRGGLIPSVNMVAASMIVIKLRISKKEFIRRRTFMCAIAILISRFAKVQ